MRLNSAHSLGIWAAVVVVGLRTLRKEPVLGLKRLALRSRGSIRALDHEAEAFLEGYAAPHRSDQAAQLAFQKAAICLEHAKHDIHKRASGWRERAEATLDEGLRSLEGRA